MNFKTLTVVVAVSVLCLILLFIGVMIERSKKNKVWPPMVSECPDYFKVVGLEKCDNTKDLGTCSGVTDFSGPEWQGESGMKKKKIWAQQCGVVWDGITN